MIGALIFDLDGTLINSAGQVLSAVNYGLSPWGITLTKQDIERIRMRPTEKLFSDLNLSEAEQFEALMRLRDYTLKNVDRVELFPGVNRLLETAGSSPKKSALWTGRDTESARAIIEYYGIEKYFDEIVGNSCVVHNKPHHEGLELLSSRLNISCQRFVIIGDHDHDIEGARTVGAMAIRAMWGGASRQNLQKADLEFSQIDQLIDWIKCLN